MSIETQNQCHKSFAFRRPVVRRACLLSPESLILCFGKYDLEVVVLFSRVLMKCCRGLLLKAHHHTDVFLDIFEGLHGVVNEEAAFTLFACVLFAVMTDNESPRWPCCFLFQTPTYNMSSLCF